MGLDISFNRTAALEAGLLLTIDTNGTEEDIAKAKEDGLDPEYIAWLASQIEVVHIPDSPLLTTNDGYGDQIVIRANKWGRVYGPMTTWLQANNITWSEY